MIKTALITESESFGKYMINPSKWLALPADGKIIAGHKISSLVFPTTIMIPSHAEDSGTTIIKKALEINASVILSFGLASEAKGFRMERSGYNWIYNERYCPAYENNYPIVPERPSKEQLQIDLSRWNIDLITKLFQKEKIPLDQKISDDLGRFSCNSWIYRTLIAMKKFNVDIPYLFFHSACTEETIELMLDFPRNQKVVIPKEYLLKALEIFLKSYY